MCGTAFFCLVCSTKIRDVLSKCWMMFEDGKHHFTSEMDPIQLLLLRGQRCLVPIRSLR